jgi:hypothetical protein
MRAVDAIILWTPDREPFTRYRTKGTIEVTRYPEQGAQTHPMSVGACEFRWCDTDENGRRKMMQYYVTTMLHEDYLPLNVVREAVIQIDEYVGFPFSTEKPSIEA